jgi:hypothetical protein
MQTVLKLSAIVVAAILAVSTSFAADGDKPRADGEGKGKGARGEGLFARVDANKDGKIDKDELAGVKEEKLAAMLKKWDANNDGEIDDKEMVLAKEAMKKRMEYRKKVGEGKKAEEKK